MSGKERGEPPISIPTSKDKLNTLFKIVSADRIGALLMGFVHGLPEDDPLLEKLLTGLLTVYGQGHTEEEALVLKMALNAPQRDATDREREIDQRLSPSGRLKRLL